MDSIIGGLGPAMVAVLWIFWFIITVCTVARVYTRIYLVRNAGWDDYMAILTWFINTAAVIILTGAAIQGVGRPSTTIRPWEIMTLIRGVRLAFIGLNVLMHASATSKAVVILFLLRLVVECWHRWLLWAVLVSVVILTEYMLFSATLNCTPIESNWNPFIKGHCRLHHVTVGGIVSAYMTVVDFGLAALPWLFVWKLNMRKKERMLITLGLSLGVFAGGASIVRAFYVFRMDVGEANVNLARAIICIQVEPSITVLCSTIPILHPLYMKLRGAPRSEQSHDYDLQPRSHINFRGWTRSLKPTVTPGTVVVTESQERVFEELSSVESAERSRTDENQIKVVKETVVSHDEQAPDQSSWQEKQQSQG